MLPTVRHVQATRGALSTPRVAPHPLPLALHTASREVIQAPAPRPHGLAPNGQRKAVIDAGASPNGP